MLNIQKIKLEDVIIHEIANSTPAMTEDQFKALCDSLQANGQEFPIVTYRGKCIDGRHRVKALRLLNEEYVMAIEEDHNQTLDDIREKVLNVYENRRHQTTTQKAIFAYKEMIRIKAIGEKMSQGEAGSKFGTTRLNISRVKTLYELAGEKVIEFLFQGNKINIGTKSKPNNTDSLPTLINYYRSRTDELIDNSNESKVSEDFTDDELNILSNTLDDLKAQFNTRMLDRLNNMIYNSIRKNYNKTK